MKVGNLLRLLISGIMLFLVLQFVDLQVLLHTLLGVPWYVVATVCVGYAAAKMLNAFKWWLIARSCSAIKASYPRALKSYFIGMFANCFGLGTVGGDLTRALLLAGTDRVRSVALASVVADRTHGLAVLAFLGTLCAAVFGMQAFESQWVYLLVAIGAAISIGWFLGPRLLLLLVRPGHPLRARAEQISEVFPKSIKMVALISVLSVIFHLTEISLHWVMASAFQAEPSWTLLLVAIPFVNIMSGLPLSWQGLGVREAGYLFFLSPTMLTQEQAVAFGAIWFFAVFLCSSVGGILAVLTQDFSTIVAAASAPTKYLKQRPAPDDEPRCAV